MSTANTADPLFMAGAVAVGMFGNPALAGLLMAAHYLGAIVTGGHAGVAARKAGGRPGHLAGAGERGWPRR